MKTVITVEPSGKVTGGFVVVVTVTEPDGTISTQRSGIFGEKKLAERRATVLRAELREIRKRSK